jgi:hypothetical protein
VGGMGHLEMGQQAVGGVGRGETLSPMSSFGPDGPFGGPAGAAGAVGFASAPGFYVPVRILLDYIIIRLTHPLCVIRRVPGFYVPVRGAGRGTRLITHSGHISLPRAPGGT